VHAAVDNFIDVSVCHFKFSKVVLAHILGGVGNFCIVKCFLHDMCTNILLKSVYI